MPIKPEAKGGGATAKIPPIGHRFGTTNNAADVITDDVASRAKTAALAEAKKIIRSGGTEAEAVAGAKEAARRVIDEGKRGSSPPTPAGATTTDATAVARGQKMGLPPRVPTNVKQGGGGKVNFLNKGRNTKEKTKNVVEKKTKTKANANATNTAAIAAASGTNKGRKAKDGKEARGLFIDLGRSPSRLPKVAVRQQAAAPEPFTEKSRDDVQQPSAERRQEATTDEIASTGRSDDGKREQTEISKVSSIQTNTIKDSSIIANDVKREVEIIMDSSIDGRNEYGAYSDMNRIGLDTLPTRSTRPLTYASANTNAVSGSVTTGEDDTLEKKGGESVASGGGGGGGAVAALLLGGRMGLPPLGPTSVSGGGRGGGGIFSKFLNKGRNAKEKTKNVAEKKAAKAKTSSTANAAAAAAAGTNKGRKVKDGKGGGRDLHMEQQHAPAPESTTESRDDNQPLAERHEATVDEMASPGRSDDYCKREIEISKDSSIQTDIRKDSSTADEAKREVEIIKDSSIADEDKSETVIRKNCGIHSHHRPKTPPEVVSDGSSDLISLSASQSLTMQDTSASATSSFESRAYDYMFDNIPPDEMDLLDIVLHAVEEALFPKNSNSEGQIEKKADTRTNGDLIEESQMKHDASSSPGIVSYFYDRMEQCCQWDFERGEESIIQTCSVGSSDDGLYFDAACAAPPASKAAIPVSKGRAENKPKLKSSTTVSTGTGVKRVIDDDGMDQYSKTSMSVSWADSLVDPRDQVNDRSFNAARAAPPASKAAIPASKSSDSFLDPSDQVNDPGVLDITSDGAHHDSSFVNATTKRLISGRRKIKKDTSSKVDGSIAKSGTLDTISNNDSPRVQSTARRLVSDRLKGKKNTSSKMADFFGKSSTMETISTKDTLPEKTGMSSLVTGSANDAPASSGMKNRIKYTASNGALSSAAGRCYFPPGGREADVAAFEEANERGSLALKDEYNGKLDGGNANRKKTGADTMGLQDDYDPNWRDKVADTVKTKALPLNENAGFRRQQKHQQTQLPGQMIRPHTVAAQHLSSGHFPPLSSYVLQNNGEGYMMSPANDRYYPNIRGNVGQWQNPQDAPGSAMFKSWQQQHHSQLPVSREPTFKINSNLSIETTEERQDRYAGLELQEVDMRDVRTLVDSGPPHSSVGMAGYAMGGYGSASMNHNGMMGQQGHHRIAGNGESDGNAGKTTWDNNTGHQMMMAHQSPHNLMVGEWGSPYNHEHHMMQHVQLPPLYEQGHQPLQQFGQINNVQQSHAQAQAQAQAQLALPMDYNYGDVQHYHQAHGQVQSRLV